MTDFPGAPASIAQPYAARPGRPPLTARAKRGAAIAGSVGFLLLGLGFAMASLAIGLALIGAFFALIVRAVSASNTRMGAGFEQLISRLDIAPWIAPLVAIVIVGIVLMVAAIVVSGLVLGAHRVRRPWAVTLAGAGVAIVASWITSSVLSAFFSIAMGGFRWDSPSWGAGFFGVLIVSAVIGLASNAVLGWLSWWWMAHAMRPAAAIDSVSQSAPIGPRA